MIDCADVIKRPLVVFSFDSRQGLSCAGKSYVNLTQAGVIREKGLQLRKCLHNISLQTSLYGIFLTSD